MVVGGGLTKSLVLPMGWAPGGLSKAHLAKVHYQPPTQTSVGG